MSAVEETERERMLHAMYDARQDLERGEHGQQYPSVARAILRGQLDYAAYPPFLRAIGESR